MRFQREPCTIELFAEMKPLFSEHWEEVAHYKDIPEEMDLNLYLKLEIENKLRVFTARTEDTNELVGYCFFFVVTNPHYKSSLQAKQDIVFIRKKNRGFGLQFISWCDEQLRYDRVQAVYHHVKAAHNFGPMLERLGYELVDFIYARRLNYDHNVEQQQG